MKTISVNIPEAFVKGLEDLCQKGLYANRSEAIRVAIRDLLKRELFTEEYTYTALREKEEKYMKEGQTITI
ncbi:MAG: ribbon-helix-helix protein, CopG family [Promethearchaeota archaeon]|nr:MAG: ribbon-helix-helix protein, CopG family [Candidatus Lokiarchaeota archaeon]